MEFKRYLKDHVPAFLLSAVALAVMLLFLLAFHVSQTLWFLIAATFVIFGVLIFLWDYFRKRKFYNQLKETVKDLDQKNLTAEIVPRPNFYEGQIFHEALYQMGKSMTEQITEKEQSVRDFKEYVEMWVHEAKLPVASLLLNTYNNQTEESRKIRQQLFRLDSYTDQILYFTRSEVAEKDFLIKSCSLNKLFAGAAARMREELQENGFNIQAAGLDCQVMTDHKWMEFILIQLISNSIKYKKESGACILKVYAKEEEKRTCLFVRDNGIGISAGDLPRIFEKSFTGENGRLREKSTGMGLYIAKKLCDKLGHGIRAGSVPGEYTEFEISFYKNDYYRP